MLKQEKSCIWSDGAGGVMKCFLNSNNSIIRTGPSPVWLIMIKEKNGQKTGENRYVSCPYNRGLAVESISYKNQRTSLSLLVFKTYDLDSFDSWISLGLLWIRSRFGKTKRQNKNLIQGNFKGERLLIFLTKNFVSWNSKKCIPEFYNWIQ